MKVLQVNCVYGAGSTGALVQTLHRALLRQGAASVVCYGRGARVRESGVRKLCPEWYAKANHLRANVTGLKYGGCRCSTRRLMEIIRHERPDLVHLHCVNGYFLNLYRLIEWLKENQVPTVLTLHAEFFYTANCSSARDCEQWRTGCVRCPARVRAPGRTRRSYQAMLRAFQGFGDGLTVVSVSPWLGERAAASPILREFRHAVIGNGVDPDVFRPRDARARRAALGFGSERVVLHVTSEFCDTPGHCKGGDALLRLADRLRGQPVRVVVAGRCRLSGPVPDNVVLLGEVTDRRLLAQYYSMADLTVLTSRQEAFSMPVAESLCCGTPVVGFRAGAPEQIALPRYSEFVPQGDLTALADCVRRWLETETDRAAVAAQARERYAAETMTRRYLACYRSLLCE